MFDPNRDATTGDTKTWTFGANDYIKDHDLKLQVNYLRFASPGGIRTQDKLIARPQAIF